MTRPLHKSRNPTIHGMSFNDHGIRQQHEIKKGFFDFNVIVGIRQMN